MMRVSAYVTNSESNSVTRIDVNTRKILATIPVGVYPQGIAVSPNGRRVYVANTATIPPNGSVSVINTLNNQVIKTIPMGKSSPIGIAVTPNGNRLWVTNYDTDSVTVIGTHDYKVRRAIHVGKQPIAIAIRPDGKFAYVANLGDGTVSVIRTATKNVVRTVRVGKQPQGIVFSADSKWAYIANANSNTVSVINTGTMKVTHTIKVGKTPIGLALSKDGKLLAVANFLGTSVWFVNTSTRKVVRKMTKFGSEPWGLAVDPKGNLWVADAGHDNVAVYKIQPGKGVAVRSVGSIPLYIAIG